MVHYGPQPQFKIEIGSDTFINDIALNVQVTRPENNISNIVLLVDDYKSQRFEDVFDTLDALTLSLRYSGDSWTEVFEGSISTVAPYLSTQKGELLQVGAWGKELCLAKTHCNTSYGLESQNTTKETPQEIWVDLVTNYINKSYGGAATGHAITTAKIADIHNDIDVTHLDGAYLDNFTLINRVCDLVQAHVGIGVPSAHWFVDPDSNLFINTIGNHENNATGWPTYYGGSQAASTIEVAKDMILYDFRKNVENYANNVVYCSALRKPAYDYGTENQSGLWGTDDITLTDDNATYIVGSYSLKAEPDVNNDDVSFWYPSAQNAAWNLEAIGSQHTIPRINFQIRINEDLAKNFYLGLHTDAANYYYMDLYNILGSTVNKWFYFSMPVGPNWQMAAENKNLLWTPQGNPDWSDIDYICFIWASSVLTTDVFLDDLHFNGKVVRQAYHSTDIGNYDEWQTVIRNDAALDDSMKAADDTGTVAMLAKAELIRRRVQPTVAMIQTPMIPDILPGQLVHIHACKKADDTFRIDKDFRIKELQHTISYPDGARTLLNLTDDVYNTHAKAAPDLMSLLSEHMAALGHGEAKNLKASGIDILVPKLSVDYG